MARYCYQSQVKDGMGRVIQGATVSVYLATTTTPALVYAALSGGSHISSVTTNTTGYFSFYVDTADYGTSQFFKIIVTATGYNSQTYDNICIYPVQSLLILPTSGGTGVANNNLSTLTITGAFPITLTISASTSVTLPTSGNLITDTGNTSGSSGSCTGNAATASNLSGTPALPNGTTATTQSAGSNDTKLATDAYADTASLWVDGGSTTSTASPTPAVGTIGKKIYFKLSALATPPTWGAPTGTPQDGQILFLEVIDNGGTQAYTWNSIYIDGASQTRPTGSIGSATKAQCMGYVYSSTLTKWVFLCVN